MIGVEAELCAREPLGALLDVDLERARVDQREAPCLSLGLGGARCSQGEEWVVQVR